MSPFLTWREEWQTGIDWIDREHREVLTRINRLADSCGFYTVGASPVAVAPATGPANALACFDLLIEYARRHFQAEEAFMARVRFPGLGEHRQVHAMELAELSAQRRTLKAQSRTALSADDLAELKRWFFDHVIAEHRELAAYCRDAGAAPDLDAA